MTARKYLKKLGCKILETNYATKFGEADIIAKDKDAYVFVEVKTRTGASHGTGAEAVTYTKQQRYIKIAQYFLLENHLSDVNVRFDVIEIENEKINYIPSAFHA